MNHDFSSDGGWHKPIDELTFADDFMFGKIMENKEICKQVLEILLDVKIGDIKYPKLQDVLNPCADAKSIRLDVFATDDKKIFDIEIQIASHMSLPLRMRYYQSLMDVDSLLKGDVYDNLKESYMIFICLFDPFGGGLPKYTFSNICHEKTDMNFNDKTHKVLYNVNGFAKEKRSALRAFLEYVKTKSVTDDFTQKLDALVEKVKHTNTHRREYLTYQVHINDWKEEGRLVGLQQGISQGLKQGISQGAHDARIETARTALLMGMTQDVVAKLSGLSIAEIEQLQLSIDNS